VGSKFNFKVVLRGDSSTGKSTLLRRLRGGSFVSEYTPTPEIRTAHIPWQARSSPEDNVMLEVWDVVDKARTRDVSESLTLAHKGDAPSGTHTFPLDATQVDVYRNCHAAVFLIDPSKKWTYEYVQRELPEVPLHIPTIILVNFRDYPASKRVLRSEEIEFDCENLFSNRPFKPFIVETSLLNCYGLQALSTFLHIPFLCLKRASLEQALVLNTAGVVQAQEALKTVKGDKYEEYERRIEKATGAGGGSDEQGKEGVTASEDDKATRQTAAPASAEEASITWERLSRTTLGEAPILLGSAAFSSLISGVTAVASMTPGEIAANASESVSRLASLETLGIKTKPKGNFDPAAREKTPPQFSHLAGRGGASAAAFGGENIDDTDFFASGPTAGMVLGGEHPDVGPPVDDDFFARSPRSARHGERRHENDAFGGRDWDEESGDGESGEDDLAIDGDRDADEPGQGSGQKPTGNTNPVVRWDDDDSSSGDEAEGKAFRDGDGFGDGESPATTPKIGVVRQISKEDPFFGGVDKKPDHVSSEQKHHVRAAEVDLDPSAIAAAFGTPGDTKESYETVDDGSDSLAHAIGVGDERRDVSKSAEARSAGKKNSRGVSSDGKTKEKKKEKQDAPIGTDFAGPENRGKKKSDKKKKKKETKEPAAGGDSSSKKASKKVKDWDESD
jgi:GTPase SAR1 family protein